jgi:hypothetical protein
MGNEAFARVVIDTQLKDRGWNVHDQNSVRYEYVLPDSSRADYVLCDRHGRALAVIEAKRFAISPGDAAEQAKGYARQLSVPLYLSRQRQGNPVLGMAARSLPASGQNFLQSRRPRTAVCDLPSPARPQCG